MTRDIVFFDGVCFFCRRWTRFVVRRDHRREYAFAWLQSTAALTHLAPELRADLDAVVLLRGAVCYRKSGAVLRIVAGLGGVWRLAALLLVVPRVLRDGCYDFIGRRRYRWFGQAMICQLPADVPADRFIDGGDVIPDPAQASVK